jgi:hypothetical protein
MYLREKALAQALSLMLTRDGEIADEADPTEIGERERDTHERGAVACGNGEICMLEHFREPWQIVVRTMNARALKDLRELGWGNDIVFGDGDHR